MYPWLFWFDTSVCWHLHVSFRQSHEQQLCLWVLIRHTSLSYVAVFGHTRYAAEAYLNPRPLSSQP